MPNKTGRLFSIGWILATVIVLCAIAAMVRAREVTLQRQAVDLEQRSARGPIVSIGPLQHGSERRAVVYPGDVHGYFESPIYPKVSGYVKSVLVDKGATVKKGQLLVSIESPELDQRVRNAWASYLLAEQTDKRNQLLLRRSVISPQQADTSHDALLSDFATWQSLKANQAYEEVTAPYDGVITARNVDPGALVAMATAQMTAVPVVVMATLKPVRVYVQMPQDDAALIKPGDSAIVMVSQLPGRPFKGTVTRSAVALNDASHTLLVEVDLPNSDLSLRPGMYAQVHITLSSNSTMPLVPDDALVFESDKTYVPVLHGDRIHLAEVTLGYDDGLRSEVISGLRGDEMIALTLGQSAGEGELVQPQIVQPRP